MMRFPVFVVLLSVLPLRSDYCIVRLRTEIGKIFLYRGTCAAWLAFR